VPVHQPADYQDDEEQADYAADPGRSAATMIAAAVEPEAAAEQNQQQHDDKNQSHRFVFHQFGNPCRAALAGRLRRYRSNRLGSGGRAKESKMQMSYVGSKASARNER
jgi:hypothetical protein